MTSPVVVFDVDDTLYLERDYVRSGFAVVGRHLEQQYGVANFTSLAWDLFVAGHRGDVFDRALAVVDRSREIDVRQLVQVYRNHAPDIELLPDSAVVLSGLRDLGIPMGVVTDGPASSQWAKIAALGLRDFTTSFVVTAELGNGVGKPHPAGFVAVQLATRALAGQFVYVADNPLKDFIAPRRLGWTTVRIRRAGSLHFHAPSNDDVDLEIGSLSELAVCGPIGDLGGWQL